MAHPRHVGAGHWRGWRGGQAPYWGFGGARRGDGREMLGGGPNPTCSTVSGTGEQGCLQKGLGRVPTPQPVLMVWVVQTAVRKLAARSTSSVM